MPPPAECVQGKINDCNASIDAALARLRASPRTAADFQRFIEELDAILEALINGVKDCFKFANVEPTEDLDEVFNEYVLMINGAEVVLKATGPTDAGIDAFKIAILELIASAHQVFLSCIPTTNP